MPNLPDSARDAYGQLQDADGSEETPVRQKLPGLDRPWLPARCTSELRADIWAWCDKVAAWLNEQYAWRPDQLIPPCWPKHPHLAQELPVIAFLRWLAEIDPKPAPLEVWQRQTFPGFTARMAARLGPGGCRDGTHADCPAQPRLAAYTNPDNVTATEKAISTDAQDQDRPPPRGGTVQAPARRLPRRAPPDPPTPRS